MTPPLHHISFMGPQCYLMTRQEHVHSTVQGLRRHLNAEEPASSPALSCVSRHSACSEEAESVGDPWVAKQAELELSSARRVLAAVAGLWLSCFSWAAPKSTSQALQSSASII